MAGISLDSQFPHSYLDVPNIDKVIHSTVMLETHAGVPIGPLCTFFVHKDGRTICISSQIHPIYHSIVENDAVFAAQLEKINPRMTLFPAHLSEGQQRRHFI